jgi:hypothetical protein
MLVPVKKIGSDEILYYVDKNTGDIKENKEIMEVKPTVTFEYIVDAKTGDLKLIVPENMEFILNSNEVILRDKKPKYPKTYEECCKILNTCCTMPSRPGYKQGLFSKFQELIICRDAYWKFLTDWWEYPEGWKPNFKDGTMKYTIECHANIIIDCGNDMTQNVILVFPTKEMRDAFYENFKDLIEECKVFL